MSYYYYYGSEFLEPRTTYGSDFLAPRTDSEKVDIKNYLRSLVVLTKVPTIMFGDDKIVLDGSMNLIHRLHIRYMIQPYSRF